MDCEAKTVKAPLPSVLIVDDDLLGAELLSLSLASEGFTTIIAGSVLEALAILTERAVTIILTDIRFFGEDTGLGLVREVAAKQYAQLCFLVSGLSEAHINEIAKDLPYDGFFEKPVEYDLLLIRLRRAIDTLPA